jgi:hypothetical protein
MHVMEPTDLWQRYIDPEFRDRAPRRLSDRKWDIRTLVEGEVMAQIPGGDDRRHVRDRLYPYGFALRGRGVPGLQ